MRRRLEPPTNATGQETARALLVTADDTLLDAVLRLAVAAGVSLDVAHDVVSARRCWAKAPLVVVGHDLLGDLAAAGLSRRAGILVVDLQSPDESGWQHAVALGAEQALLLPDAEGELLDRLADAAEPRVAGRTVGVIAGQGGSGASVLAATLARGAARRGVSPLLVDVDPLGGGLDLVLGAEAEPGLRWPDLMAARGRLPGAQLRESLPALDGVWLLSHGRADAASRPSPEAVAAVIDGGRRAFGLVVVDLPRHLDVAGSTALSRCGVGFLVVRDEVRAVAAASCVADLAGRAVADLRVVVRAMGRTGLGARTVASGLGLPLAGELPHLPGLARDLEVGIPPGRGAHGRLSRLCDRLLDDLGVEAVAA
jgi:secretion/DNA translocation related CpaE-like protein